jgi:hypothetical protein
MASIALHQYGNNRSMAEIFGGNRHRILKRGGIIAAENDIEAIMTDRGDPHFEEMTDILNTTKIEYFGMGRALIKGANLTNKFEKKYRQV